MDIAGIAALGAILGALIVANDPASRWELIGAAILGALAVLAGGIAALGAAVLGALAGGFSVAYARKRRNGG